MLLYVRCTCAVVRRCALRPCCCPLHRLDYTIFWHMVVSHLQAYARMLDVKIILCSEGKQLSKTQVPIWSIPIGEKCRGQQCVEAYVCRSISTHREEVQV